MKDRVPTYPGRVTLVPVSGQTNTYDMAMADEPTEEGMALNKANLLSDATAAAINQLAGTTPDVPNDALRLLTAALTATNTTVETRAKIQTGSYVGTGTYGADNPCSLTFDFAPFILEIYLDSYPASGKDVSSWGGYTWSQRRVRFMKNPDKVGYQYIPVRADYGDLNFHFSGNTISWYTPLVDDFQMNRNNTKYYWIAIG